MADIHPKAQALVDHWNDAPNTYEFTAEEARQMRAEMHKPVTEPEPVGDVTDVVVHRHGHGIPARVYVPEGEGPFPVFVWAHGGGFILGNVELEDSVARALTNATNCVVVSVEYRLAPEHKFPAGLRDVYAVTEWVVENASDYDGDPDRLVVGGQSAGGTLAAGTTLLAREENGPDIDYQVLVYPVMAYTEAFPSRTEFDGYVLDEDGFDWIRDSYFHDPIQRHNPYASPIESCDHSDLPSTTLVTAGFDPLQDEADVYAAALESASVPIEHHHYGDMVHGFFSQTWDRSREAVAEIGDDVRMHVE